MLLKFWPKSVSHKNNANNNNNSCIGLAKSLFSFLCKIKDTFFIFTYNLISIF